MDQKQELRLRCQAIRLRLKGIKSKSILDKVHRSRFWLSKWQKRFNQQGAAGLHSHSRQPHHTPTVCSARIVRLIVQTRRRLVQLGVNKSILKWRGLCPCTSTCRAWPWCD